MDKILLIGGPEIAKYTVAGSLWPMISKRTGIVFEHVIKAIESSEKLELFISNIRKDPTIKGFNVALPWKEEIMKHVDIKDDFTNKYGICNTIVNTNGKLTTHNTDVFGIVEPYEKIAGKIDKKSVLILGAGGAGRSLSYYLSDYKNCNVYLFDIDRTKFKRLIKEIKNIRVVMDYEEVDKIITKCDLVVNATPIGKFFFRTNPDSYSSPIKFETILLAKYTAVFQEMNYYPIETEFLNIASHLGHLTIEGTKMLAFQALKTLDYIYKSNFVDTLGFEINQEIEQYVHKNL
ncbi:MAG: hypothetical protein ACD_61C00007G0009 [uncultured bacterium]|nr:MAG: hypothetical protein ACD_61C00007G0009 [uncultured bacterium]